MLLTLTVGLSGSALWGYIPGNVLQKAKDTRSMLEQKSADDAAFADRGIPTAPAPAPAPASKVPPPTHAPAAPAEPRPASPASEKKSGYAAVGLPGRADVVLERSGFMIGYSEQHKQPAWVIYRITKEQALAKPVKRGTFREDEQILKGRAKLDDYVRSGYFRGQLVPAGDMAYSVQTMNDAYLLSNASPQKSAFNRGVWKKLEAQIRHFAIQEKEIWVVSGPIFPKTPGKSIGKGKITVPTHFFKVVYDPAPPEKMIGFIVPNEAVTRPLQRFAVPVEAVEKATGLVFFAELPPHLQSLKKTMSVKDWQWLK